MKITIGEVELQSDGKSSKGADRFKGQVQVGEVRLYVTAYGPAPEGINAAKSPAIRTGTGSTVKPIVRKQEALPLNLEAKGLEQLVAVAKAMKAKGLDLSALLASVPG